MQKSSEAILMSAPMVVSTRLRRKELTSRLTGLDEVNEYPDSYELLQVKNLDQCTVAVFKHYNGAQKALYCPFGGEGTELWVRENLYVGKGYDTIKPRDLPFDYTSVRVGWMADGPKPDWAGKTRASIHLPQRASRLTLQVRSVAVQRLTDLSEGDAKLEGVPNGIFREGPNQEKGEFHLEHNVHGNYLSGFRFTIMTLHGREIWAKNPWCWRIYFNLLNDKT